MSTIPNELHKRITLRGILQAKLQPHPTPATPTRWYMELAFMAYGYRWSKAAYLGITVHNAGRRRSVTAEPAAL